MTASWPDGAPVRLVVLAAGASLRLGFPKALAPLPGGFPVVRLLQAGRAGTSGPPLVVTGVHHAETVSALERAGLLRDVQVVHNPDAAQGRTGSLQRAAQYARGEAWMVAPVDCPRVPARVFAQLLAAWKSAAGPTKGWIGPYVQASASGARTFGHPILMGPELVAALRALDPDTPLSTLRAQAHPLLACAVTRVEIVEDLDTPADFDRLCKADRDPL